MGGLKKLREPPRSTIALMRVTPGATIFKESKRFTGSNLLRQIMGLSGNTVAVETAGKPKW
jgi:hypothetical protein